MKYDFESLAQRRGSNSVKWDIFKDEDVLPMWVADMDFKAAPFIIDALKKKIENGVFGYTLIPTTYFEAVHNWFQSRYGWDINKELILPISAVVPAISQCIQAFTEEGEGVLIQTPAYNCFFSAIKDNNRELIENPLIYKRKEGNSFTYEIDFKDFEAKCKKAKLFLLCSPHNPGGRVWTKEELAKMGEICRKNGVKVVSDEIHCELVAPGTKFTPYPLASAENAKDYVVLNSPSKNFNIAGLHIANIITSNTDLYKKINARINANHIGGINSFGVEALEAAYSKEGEEWLEQLNQVIHNNYLYFKNELAKECPDMAITILEGTYLGWIDCRCLDLPCKEVVDSLEKVEKVRPNDGKMYGCEGFIRINFATQPKLMQEGTKRIIEGFKRLHK